jgi:hypothetical protein
LKGDGEGLRMCLCVVVVVCGRECAGVGLGGLIRLDQVEVQGVSNQAGQVSGGRWGVFEKMRGSAFGFERDGGVGACARVSKGFGCAWLSCVLSWCVQGCGSGVASTKVCASAGGPLPHSRPPSGTAARPTAG